MPQSTTAVVFIELSGATAVSGAAAESPATSAREAAPGRVLEEVARRHGAGGLDRHDGGALAVFETGAQAIRCAFDVIAVATDRPGRDCVRVGIDVPVDPEARDEAVTVAQALSRSAEAGEIRVSATARAAICPEPGIALDCLGLIEAASAAFPVEAYRARRAVVQAGSSRLRFGRFTVDPSRREMYHDSLPVPLEPLTFDLLLLLLRNSHRVVSRDEIFANLWSGRIVSDTALSSQIKVLRKALGDSGDAQHTVGTIHGRGFRFLRDVAQVDAAIVPPAVEQQPFRQGLDRPLVAVLPFDNLSTENSGQFFADGITEDILNALSKHRWIGVVARNPAFAFRNSRESLDAIARQLGASYVVTGSVQRMGERMRIYAEAVEIRSLRKIWSDSFATDIAQVFDIQGDLCGTIAARLATELGVSEQQQARRLPRSNRGAWELYHLGMSEFYRFSVEGNRRAQEFLRMAIRAAPDVADPYTRLAYAITLEMVYFEGRVSPSRMDDALDLALRGLDRDDRDPQGHFALGRVRLARREYDLAIDALEHALDLNPYLAVSHCGLGDSLAYEGYINNSIRHFERAIELSPHDPFRWAFHSYKSLAHLFGQDDEAATREALRAVQVPNAHYSAHANLLAALGHTGDRPRIERARSGLLRAKPDFTLDLARARLFYLKSRSQLDRYLEGLTRAGIT
jgi:TolB-like protein